jgi:hypothetical protein
MIRLKTLVAVEPGVTSQVIRAFGDRATSLLTSMLENMRNPERSLFVASVASSHITPSEIPLIKREISSRGSAYLNDIQDTFTKRSLDSRASVKSAPSTRLSVTVFYSESQAKRREIGKAPMRRRNFRRSK